MASGTPNTYRFYCQVVEVIHKDGGRLIKTMCKPGSLIIETPDDGITQLGDMLIVTGKFLIETMESNKSVEKN
jgi:hypothetical protein